MRKEKTTLNRLTYAPITQSDSRKYLDDWFTAAPLRELPLLALESDGITPIVEPNKKGIPCLICSSKLVDAITNLGREITSDWKNSRGLEGITYLVYRRSTAGAVEPLYVGIANSANKSGSKPSSLWASKSGARFSHQYRSNGHVDCLSRSLIENYEGYAHWVRSLFGLRAIFSDGKAPPLLSPVFVHFEEWDVNARRILPFLPDAPLYVEEMLRLWILQLAGYGERLLNRNGNLCEI